MSDGTFEGARGGDRTEVLTGTSWPGSPERVTFHPSADEGLGREAPTEDGSLSFTGDSRGFVAPEETDGATFRTAPLEDDMVLAGQPALQLAASVTSPRVHLIANLFDENPDGDWRRISQCTINPELRDGLAQRQLVVPGERYEMEPPCFAMAHHLREGHRLVLRVTTSDPDKVPMFAQDVQVTVFTGPGGTSLEVPVVASPGALPGHGAAHPGGGRRDRSRAGSVRELGHDARPRRGPARGRRDESVRGVRRSRGRGQREGRRAGHADACRRTSTSTSSAVRQTGPGAATSPPAPPGSSPARR